MEFTQKDIERFWSKVDKSGGPDACWPWIGARNKYGYGVFSRRDGSNIASRTAYEIENGTIPPGLYCLHHCDHPWCQNPAHFFLGTYADNAADMVRKGRHVKAPNPGEKNGWAKLTEVQVREILADGDSTNEALGARFGVTGAAIYLIRRGRNWHHIFVEGHAIVRDLAYQRGESGRGAKLTEKQVREIRAHPEISQPEFARRFGVSRSNIGAVRLRKSWTHI